LNIISLHNAACDAERRKLSVTLIGGTAKMSPLEVSAADEMYERGEAARETREPVRRLRRVIGREFELSPA
jgi:hypothetical protein